MLIAIEGNNGAGKTTIIQKLKTKLMDYEVIVSENNSTKLIKEILYSARDSYQVIDPALYQMLQISDLWVRVTKLQEKMNEQNVVVLFDRYIETILVRDAVRGINIDQNMNLYQLFPKPDVTIFLDISPEESFKRVINRQQLVNKMWCIALRYDLEPETLNAEEYIENLRLMNQIYHQNLLGDKLVLDANESMDNNIDKVIQKFIDIKKNA